LSNVIGVSGGDGFTAALLSDHTVWTWGYNGFGSWGWNVYQSIYAGESQQLEQRDLPRGQRLSCAGD